MCGVCTDKQCSEEVSNLAIFDSSTPHASVTDSFKLNDTLYVAVGAPSQLHLFKSALWSHGWLDALVHTRSVDLRRALVPVSFGGLVRPSRNSFGIQRYAFDWRSAFDGNGVAELEPMTHTPLADDGTIWTSIPQANSILQWNPSAQSDASVWNWSDLTAADEPSPQTACPIQLQATSNATPNDAMLWILQNGEFTVAWNDAVNDRAPAKDLHLLRGVLPGLVKSVQPWAVNSCLLEFTDDRVQASPWAVLQFSDAQSPVQLRFITTNESERLTEVRLARPYTLGDAAPVPEHLRHAKAAFASGLPPVAAAVSASHALKSSNQRSMIRVRDVARPVQYPCLSCKQTILPQTTADRLGTLSTLDYTVADVDDENQQLPEWPTVAPESVGAASDAAENLFTIVGRSDMGHVLQVVDFSASTARSIALNSSQPGSNLPADWSRLAQTEGDNNEPGGVFVVPLPGATAAVVHTNGVMRFVDLDHARMTKHLAAWRYVVGSRESGEVRMLLHPSACSTDP